MLKNRKASEVPVIFLGSKSISLPESVCQVRQFWVTWYPSDLHDSLLVAFEKREKIVNLISDLNGESDRASLDLTDSLGRGSQAGIHGDYEHPREASSVVRGPVYSSVVDLLSLPIRELEAMIRLSILKGHVSALDPTSFPKSMHIGESESKLLSKNRDSTLVPRSFYQPSVIFVLQVRTRGDQVQS